MTPPLSSLMSHGYKVALVTDGRMSGASGKVPAAIHVTPEALDGGAIAQVQDGDIIALDCEAQTLTLEVDAATLAARRAVVPDLSHNHSGTGRELFALMRQHAGRAEDGASPILGRS